LGLQELDRRKAKEALYPGADHQALLEEMVAGQFGMLVPVQVPHGYPFGQERLVMPASWRESSDMTSTSSVTSDMSPT